MREEINDLWDRVIALDGRYSDLERRTEILEQRIAALEIRNSGSPSRWI